MNLQSNLLSIKAATTRGVIGLCLLFVIFISTILPIINFPLPMDFGSFIASGSEAAAGRNPFTYVHKLIFVVPIDEFNLSIPSPNLNPPVSILFFELLANPDFNPSIAAMIWKGVSFLGYILIICMLIINRTHNINPLKILWAFSMAGLWQTIEVGQIYMPLIILAVFIWQAIKEGRDITVGVLIGFLISIKPQFAIWPLFLLGKRNYKIFFASMVTCAIVAIIPVWVYGLEIYIQWIQAIRQYNGILLPGNTSLQSLAAHLGLSSAGNLLGVVLFLFVLGFTVNNPIDNIHTSALAILVTILVSPYSWSGYTLFLLPMFLEDKKWSLKKAISASLLAVPFLIIQEAYVSTRITFLLIGWMYGWSVVLLLWNEVSKSHAKAES